MKFLATILLLAAMVHSSLGAGAITFGLLVCEDGPVVYRSTLRTGETFGTNPPSRSQCKAGTSICNQQFGYFASHRGLGMCSVSRDCTPGQQVCLRKFKGAQNTIIACCKVAHEGWVLTGRQQITGNQNPPPQPGLVRMAVSAGDLIEEIDN